PYHAEIPHHPAHSPFIYGMSRMHGDMEYQDGICTANDIITTGSHTGTHIDAIGHVSCHGYLHDNISVQGNQSKTSGLAVKGIEHTKPIIKRAILLDIASLKNVPFLPHGYGITKEDIEEAVTTHNIKI